MTIAIDIRAALEPYGGIPEYARSVVGHILRLPSDHRFVLFSNSRSIRPEVDIPSSSSRAPVAYFRIPNKAMNASLFLTGRPYLDAMIGRKAGMSIDVFFMPNMNFSSISPKVKTVLTMHDLSFESYRSLLPAKDRLWHACVNPRRLLVRADALIAVSKSTKNDLVKHYGVPEKKVYVTHLACGDEFAQGNEQSISRFALNLPHRYILGLGGGARKNNEALLAAYALLCTRLPRESLPVLLLIGLEKRSRVLFSRRVREHGIQAHVRLASHIPFAYRQSYYAHAECFVYPSYTEGFGIPPLEAAASGTPVIASAAGSIPEIMGSAAYLVDPYNTAEIAEALQLMCTNKDVREQYRVRGKERAKQFSWETCARQTLTVLESV